MRLQIYIPKSFSMQNKSLLEGTLQEQNCPKKYFLLHQDGTNVC